MKTNSMLIMAVMLCIVVYAGTGLAETNYTDISTRVKKSVKPIERKKTYPGSFKRENEIKLRKLARQYHDTSDTSKQADLKRQMKEILEEEYEKSTELKNKQLENLDVKRRARRKQERRRDRSKKDIVDERLEQLLKKPIPKAKSSETKKNSVKS